MVEFARAIVSAARQVAEDKRLRLESYVDPTLGTVLTDRDKLDKIILNLVFNALKFTPSGGRVEVRLTRNGKEAEIQVSDTGEGIPEDLLPKIFEPFFTTKPIGKGTGLGLSISYGIVQEYQGTLRVETVENEGSNFIIQFPAQVQSNG